MLDEKNKIGKYFLLLAVMLAALAFGASGARVEQRNSDNGAVNAIADNVPGATIDEDWATAKPGYVFVQESRNSVAVIKTGRGTARLQTGSLQCVSASNATCYAFITGSKTVARCKGNGECHFIGIRGGVNAPPTRR